MSIIVGVNNPVSIPRKQEPKAETKTTEAETKTTETKKATTAKKK